MFLQWAVPGSLTPLYTVRLEALGFSPMDIALCCATQAFAAVLSSLVAGQIADRWLAAEKAMAICAVLSGLDLWLLAELREPLPMFLATLGFWLLAGPMLLLGTTVSFSHLEKPERQFGPVRMWGTVGWMAIGWLGGYWLAHPDWLASLLVWVRPDSPRPRMADTLRLGGLVSFVLAAYCLTLPSTPPRQRVRASRVLAPVAALGLLRQSRFAIYCACLLGACTTFPFTTQNTPLLLKELGVERHWLTPALTVAQTTEIFCLAILPGILLRFGVRGTMMLGLGAWLAAMCVLSVGRPVGLIVASLGLNGLFVTGFMITGQVYVNSLAADDLRTSTQGLLTCVNGLGLLVGNLLASWLRQLMHGELAATFLVAAGITAFMLILFLAGFRQRALQPVDSRQ